MTPPNTAGLREEIAELIYTRAFNPPVPWVPRGNSQKQDEARQIANAAIALMVDEELAGRLEARAAMEERDSDTVRGPAFGQPWGQDIIDRHKAFAADLRKAASRLRGQEGGGE